MNNYKPLGNYIQKVDKRNKDLKIAKLYGLSMNKEFRESTSNTVGTDMSKYKVMEKYQFACDFMSPIRVNKLPVVLKLDDEPNLVSPAYPVFEVKDRNKLDPEYLMMWFRRPEFDRYASFKCDAAIRGGYDWEELCNTTLPVPSIEKQKEIVAEYNTVKSRIALNNKLIQKLEETAQAIYKQWFVDFEFPDENGNPYKSSGGKMVYNEELDKEIPEGWENKSLKEICSKIGSGATPKGGKESYKESGISFIRSTNVFDYCFSIDDLVYIDDKQAEGLKNVVVESKDILFNITGVSVARCTIVPDYILPARVNQHVMIIRPKIEANYYLLFLLCHSESKSKLLAISQSGSTRESITKTDIEEFQITLPSKFIIEKFEILISELFGMMEINKKEINSLNLLLEIMHSKLATI
jgi:type I restriction enzyme S subunit